MDEEPKKQGEDETENDRTQHYKDYEKYHEKWRDERKFQDKSNYDNSYKLMFKLMLILNSGGIVILVTNFLPKSIGENILLYQCQSIIMLIILLIFLGGLGCAFFVVLRDFVLCRRSQSDFLSLYEKLSHVEINYNESSKLRERIKKLNEFNGRIKESDDENQNGYKAIDIVGKVSFILGFLGAILLLIPTCVLIFSQ